MSLRNQNGPGFEAGSVDSPFRVERKPTARMCSAPLLPVAACAPGVEAETDPGDAVSCHFAALQETTQSEQQKKQRQKPEAKKQTAKSKAAKEEEGKKPQQKARFACRTGNIHARRVYSTSSFVTHLSQLVAMVFLL